MVMDWGVFDAQDEDFSKADPTSTELGWARRNEADNEYTFVSNWYASRPYLDLTAFPLILA